LSIGRCRSAHRQHVTSVPSPVWKTNAAPACAVPQASQQGPAVDSGATDRF
jgi:hypothetical protein